VVKEEVDAIKKILERERKARKQAESIIEQKSKELYLANQNLAELNKSLEQKIQKRTAQLTQQNHDLENTKNALEYKIKELKEASQYKSEFMANMSHELRTPLNSILILAQMLQGNAQKNLTPKQVEFATVIHNSGNDLLNLINDILDLAKIEAGKMEVQLEKVSFAAIKQNLYQLFEKVAENKQIDFHITHNTNLEFVETDQFRLLQILRNLLSNAFKFTERKGQVHLKIEKPTAKQKIKLLAGQYKNQNIVQFSVKDTGIGIPPNKLDLIFESFQQVDGSTSRKYGGTGLGLSISNELVNLLGGQITVESQENVGSEFSVYIPLNFSNSIAQKSIFENQTSLSKTDENQIIDDDRLNLKKEEKPILIIEDDLIFAGILREYANEKGHKVVILNRGDMAIEYVKAYKPKTIILDIQLPGSNGWTILRSLKTHQQFQNIPVHIVSAINKQNLGRKLGAITYNVKPITQNQLETVFENINGVNVNQSIFKCIVVGEQINSNLLQCINKYFSVLLFCENPNQALQIIETSNADFMLLINSPIKELELVEFLEHINNVSKQKCKHIHLLLSKNLKEKQEETVEKLSNVNIINPFNDIDFQIKNIINAIKIEDEITHKNKSYKTEINKLNSKTILIVDDESRNIFALKSFLEIQDLNIVTANNGKQAVQLLEKSTNINLVLMDIMMPVMNGYEAMEAIRDIPKYEKLPIIALTAKAMKGDKEKCISAGASDYITKPIEVEKLLALIKIWLEQ